MEKELKKENKKSLVEKCVRVCVCVCMHVCMYECACVERVRQKARDSTIQSYKTISTPIAHGYVFNECYFSKACTQVSPRDCRLRVALSVEMNRAEACVK